MDTIEIYLSDISNKSIPEFTPGYPVNFTSLFERQIDEMLGGMLCIDHMHLPNIFPLMEEGKAWLLKIECCCTKQSAVVQERLKAFFEQ